MGAWAGSFWFFLRTRRTLPEAQLVLGRAQSAPLGHSRAQPSRQLAGPVWVPCAAPGPGGAGQGGGGSGPADAGRFMCPLRVLPGCAFPVWDGSGSPCGRPSCSATSRGGPPLQADRSGRPRGRVSRQGLGCPAESLGTATAPCTLLCV